VATNFRFKIGEIGLLTFNAKDVALAFLNGMKYRNSDFRSFVCNDMATLYKKNLVNFGPVTPEFKKCKLCTPLVDQQSLLCRSGYTLGSPTHF